MSNDAVPSRDPDLPLAVVRGRQAARRGGRESRGGRPIAVVLGMHRSGASLISGILHDLGVDMVETGDHAGLDALQDEVLAAIGRPIASPEHCLPFPPGWWRRKEVQAIKPRISAFVEGELAKSTDLWGFKDPRTCRLLPLWWEIFRELDLAPIYVHAVRAPAESAVSMSLEDPSRAISATQGELMWIAYNYDILRYVALDHPTHTVNYADWFGDGARVARRLIDALGIGEGFSDDDLRDCVGTGVRGDLRHHVAGKGDVVSRMPIAGLLYDAVLAEQTASGAGSRALKNQMSFIGLLMKSTAPIIADLASVAERRATDATSEAGHAERAKALDEQIANLTRKVQSARAEAETLRAAADIARRIEALDAHLLRITTGDLGQRIEHIDKRTRELRHDMPPRLEEIGARLSRLTDGDAVAARLNEIGRHLTTLATEASLAPRLAGIETRLAEAADGRAIGTRFDAVEARLAALAADDGVKTGLEAMRAALAARPDGAMLGAIEHGVSADDGGVKVRLADIEAGLRALAEDEAVASRLVLIQAQLDEIAATETRRDVAGRLDTLDTRIGQIATGGLGQRIEQIDKRLHELRADLPGRLEDIVGRLARLADDDAVPVRLAAIGRQVEALATDAAIPSRLAAIETQLGRTAEAEALAARFDTIEARLGDLAEGEPLAAKLAAIEVLLGRTAEDATLAARFDTIEARLGGLAERDVNGARLADLAGQLTTLVEAAATAERTTALEIEAARLRADNERLAARLASRTRRARAVIAAARGDRAALDEQRRDAERRVDELRRTGDRLSVERSRTQRLSGALAARDEQIAGLKGRIGATIVPVDAHDARLAWPGIGSAAPFAEDYGVVGEIDRVDQSGVEGWVRFSKRPDLVPIVELAVDGLFVLAQACVPTGDRHGFTIAWRDVPSEHAGRPAIVRVAGIERAIGSAPLIVPDGRHDRHRVPTHVAAALFGVSVAEAEGYHASLAENGEDDALADARTRLAAGETAWPVISVVVYGDDAAGRMTASVGALRAQVYPYWEALCLDAPATLEAFDPRVRVVPSASGVGEIASGDLVSFVEAGDLIAPTALFHLAMAAHDDPDFALIYSDEDLIDPPSGVRGAPLRKGDRSDDPTSVPDATRLALIPRDRLPEDFQATDAARIQRIVTAAAAAAPANVIHLPRILYHRAIERARTGG